jgi:hypothetical protein
LIEPSEPLSITKCLDFVAQVIEHMWREKIVYSSLDLAALAILSRAREETPISCITQSQRQMGNQHIKEQVSTGRSRFRLYLYRIGNLAP